VVLKELALTGIEQQPSIVAGPVQNIGKPHRPNTGYKPADPLPEFVSGPLTSRLFHQSSDLLFLGSGRFSVRRHDAAEHIKKNLKSAIFGEFGHRNSFSDGQVNRVIGDVPRGGDPSTWSRNAALLDDSCEAKWSRSQYPIKLSSRDLFRGWRPCARGRPQRDRLVESVSVR
jgi:hypothetical protein